MWLEQNLCSFCHLAPDTASIIWFDAGVIQYSTLSCRNEMPLWGNILLCLWRHDHACKYDARADSRKPCLWGAKHSKSTEHSPFIHFLDWFIYFILFFLTNANKQHVFTSGWVNEESIWDDWLGSISRCVFGSRSSGTPIVGFRGVNIVVKDGL